MTRTILSIAPGALASPTFSRAGTATYFDSNGVLQTAAANVVRDAHYEQGVRTILLEGAGSNLVPNTNGRPNTVTPSGTTPPTVTVISETTPFGTEAYQVTFPAGAPANSNCTAVTDGFTMQFDGSSYVAVVWIAGTIANVHIEWTGTAGIAPLVATGRTLGAYSEYRLVNSKTGGGSGTERLFFWPSVVPAAPVTFRIGAIQFEHAGFASSLMLGSPAPVNRSADLVGWPIPDAPHAMEWVVGGLSHGQHAVAALGVAYLGNDAATGARVWIESTGTGYQIVHHNGTTQVTSAIVTSPAAGARLDFRAELYADGSVQLFLSVAGAAEIAGNKSAALAFAPAWGGQTFRLNSRGTGSQGNAAYISATVTDLHVPQPSVSWTDAQGAATLPLQVRAFEQWVPLTNSVADRETALGTGQTFEYQYRVDYGAAFRLPYLKPSQLDLCARLKLQLLSGGSVTVFTDDTGYRSYVCTLWPGADVPDPELTDRNLLWYSQALQVRNTQAAPMLCVYQGAS